MTIYEFRKESGEIVEENYAFGKAPHLGEEVEIEGHGLCTRIFSSHVQTRERKTVGAFASQTIDPHDAKRLGHKHFDDDGSPVFMGKTDAEEFSKKSEGMYPYDALPTVSEIAAKRRPWKEVARRKGLL
jgi:hypothetical protein